MKTSNNSIKEWCLVGLFSAILIVQKIALSFLPNISFTIFFIIVFSKLLKIGKTSLIIFIFVLIDAIGFGTLNIFYTPVTFIGYLLIPIFLNTIFKKIEKPIFLALLSILFSIIYCWLYMIPNTFIYHMDFVSYLIMDLPFEGIMAASSFLSVLLLYNPLMRVLEKYKFSSHK